MGFNYASEKRKFEKKWAKLWQEYKAAGMSDAAIQEMHDFDWNVFKQERIYQLHTQEMGVGVFDEPSTDQEDKSALMKKFLEAVSCWDDYAGSSRYCRVSTDDEEQLTSYEAQQTYYTDKIMTNRDWTMAGIFADEGITGTSARKRPEFLKMIRLCKQKKIDIVLTKSISRFARNTVDCLNYIRALRELGIAVIFEKENINTLEADSEILITMLGAFAQAESESISANVRWGKRQAIREGKTIIQYKRLYAYEKGEDDKPKIIPEQAEVVRSIYDQYLTGASLRMIKDRLEAGRIPNV